MKLLSSIIIKTVFKKRVLLSLIALFIVCVYFINLFLTQTEKKSKATGESVEVSFELTTLNGGATDTLPALKIMGKPSIDISVRGYEITLTFNKNHLFVQEINYPSSCPAVDGYSTTPNQANQLGSIRIACANTTTSGFVLSASTPQEVARITFKSNNSSTSTISINPSTIGFAIIDSSRKLTTIGASNQQNITATATTGNITSTPTQPPNNNPTQPPNDTPTQPQNSNVNINLTLKFQGIINCPSNNKKMSVKIKLGGRTKTDYQTGIFSCQDDKWIGSVSFNIPPGDGYYLLVKGEKHIQKKICELNYKEPVGAEGSYRCLPGISLNLVQGDNNFDLSAITLLAGDLPNQDGVVNSYDTSLVKNNLGKRDEEALNLADINLDGIVNTQDHSLIIYALSVRVDEE